MISKLKLHLSPRGCPLSLSLRIKFLSHVFKYIDRFYVKQCRYPGLDESSLAADASLLADELRAFVQEAGAAEAMNEALMDAHAQELARFGASELHAVASVVGGVASQEAVKVIARQYEPVDHTYVFNGIAGVGGVGAV